MLCPSLDFRKRPTSNEKEPRRTKKLIENLFNGVYKYNRRKYSKIVNKSRRVENANEILPLIQRNILEVYESGMIRDIRE
jgi:hypothetical protein